MGHTAMEWTTTAASKLLDESQIDIGSPEVWSIGVIPAIAQFSIDRPRSVAVDLAPSTHYLSLPSGAQGWVDGWSRVTAVEAPAGETPPCRLAPGEWFMTRDPATPATHKIMLRDQIASGETARVFFTSTWPTPTSTAADDLISDVAFQAITALAAAMVASALAIEAARSRQGGLPTDFVDGSDRTRDLLDVAGQLRVIYNTFIGLGATDATSGASNKTLRSVRIG